MRETLVFKKYYHCKRKKIRVIIPFSGGSDSMLILLECLRSVFTMKDDEMPDVVLSHVISRNNADRAVALTHVRSTFTNMQNVLEERYKKHFQLIVSEMNIGMPSTIIPDAYAEWKCESFSKLPAYILAGIAGINTDYDENVIMYGFNATDELRYVADNVTNIIEEFGSALSFNTNSMISVEYPFLVENANKTAVLVDLYELSHAIEIGSKNRVGTLSDLQVQRIIGDLTWCDYLTKDKKYKDTTCFDVNKIRDEALYFANHPEETPYTDPWEAAVSQCSCCSCTHMIYALNAISKISGKRGICPEKVIRWYISMVCNDMDDLDYLVDWVSDLRNE